MRVLLVDDHPLFRQGLLSLLEEMETLEVVGEASNGSEALALAGELKPDVVIMDITMPGKCGLEATRQLKQYYPHIKVVILSGHADSVYVDQALKAGALGYVYKDAAFDELSIALAAMEKGLPYLSPAVLSPVVKSYILTAPEDRLLSEYNKLTDREKEVFKLLVKGRSRNLIAETLHISPRTVDRHRSNLLKKLGLSRDDELKDFAKRAGLIESKSAKKFIVSQ